jgi:peptide/nickel transport system ATP-binding protein
VSAVDRGTPLLEARNLEKHFRIGNSLLPSRNRTLYAVDGVSLSVWRGETLGIVGESGCGKSTLGRCLVRLYDLTAGELLLDGQDIARLGRARLRPLRRAMQMIFQDPSASLNPRRRIGDLIAEPLRVHHLRRGRAVRERVRELMGLVGLPASAIDRYPHEFSGGQRQRIGIARALAVEPRLIVADEPVSALDVSIQAQIVNLLADLQERLGLTYIFIAHDLSVVRQVSSRTAVMYLGSIVETGRTDTIYPAPAHPYTEALLSAVPVPSATRPDRRRIILEGDPPSPLDPPAGCRFHPRCRYAAARCHSERPMLRRLPDGREVACHFPLAGDTPAAEPASRPGVEHAAAG